jgi:hypothetical protein
MWSNSLVIKKRREFLEKRAWAVSIITVRIMFRISKYGKGLFEDKSLSLK